MNVESPRARQAWADYLAMGPDRSLAKLGELYVERRQTGGKSGVPTRSTKQLERWSVDFGWQSRLQEIATTQIAMATAAEVAHVREIMQTGYALPYERVAVLKELADALLGDLRDPDRRWLRDVKGIGQGDNWTQIEIERFNSAELEQLRGLLDDIAKETGGRPKTLKIDVEQRIRVMAEELGLDPDEAVAEAQRVLRESTGAGTR